MSKKRISKASENQRSWIYQYTPLSLSLLLLLLLSLFLFFPFDRTRAALICRRVSPRLESGTSPVSGRLTNMKWWNSWGKSGETDEADIFFFFFLPLFFFVLVFSLFFFYGEREGDGGEEDLYTLATFESTLNKWSVIQACIDLKWFHNIFMDLCV